MNPDDSRGHTWQLTNGPNFVCTSCGAVWRPDQTLRQVGPCPHNPPNRAHPERWTEADR